MSDEIRAQLDHMAMQRNYASGLGYTLRGADLRSLNEYDKAKALAMLQLRAADEIRRAVTGAA